MTLEHLNLVVADIEAQIHFYQCAFPHWRLRGEGESDWNGKARRWCHFGDEHCYLTFNDNGEGRNRDLAGHQTGLAHFAFTTQALDALTQRLLDAGYKISNPGVEHRFRSNVYFLDPAGFEVEFVQYHSDSPEQRNQYD